MAAGQEESVKLSLRRWGASNDEGAIFSRNGNMPRERVFGVLCALLVKSTGSRLYGIHVEVFMRAGNGPGKPGKKKANKKKR